MFRNQSLRRALAGLTIGGLLGLLCPPPVAAQQTPTLLVYVAPATAAASLPAAVVQQFNEALRVAFAASGSYRLVEETGEAGAAPWAAAPADQMRAVASRAGADVVLLSYVSAARVGDGGFADAHVSFRLIDVVSGQVLVEQEAAGVSSAAPVAAEAKLAQAINAAARQVVGRLSGAGTAGLCLSYNSQGRIVLGAGALNGLAAGTWLMVFRGAKYLGAVQVTDVSSGHSQGELRYLKGVRSLIPSDEVRFMFLPPEALRFTTESTAAPKRSKSSKTWRTVLGVLAVAGLAYLLLDNNDSSPAATTTTGGTTAGAGLANWVLTTTPAGAAVTLDGQATGRITPTTFSNLSAAQHTVTLTLAGFNDHTLTVTLTDGQTRTDTIALTPGGNPPGAPPAPQP